MNEFLKKAADGDCLRLASESFLDGPDLALRCKDQPNSVPCSLCDPDLDYDHWSSKYPMPKTISKLPVPASPIGRTWPGAGYEPDTTRHSYDRCEAARLIMGRKNVAPAVALEFRERKLSGWSKDGACASPNKRLLG